MDTNNKEILIHNESLLKDIQGAFSARYPFLKIEFLQTDNTAKTLRSAKIDNSTALKQIANVGVPQKLDINSNRTVSDISHDLQHTLGVIVQVFRKSGNVWNVISVTEGWTLENQNSAGEFISSEMASSY
ncbi:MAG: hypothetical protein JWQ96_565 [Segetibacter sp.]|nr:hypothetical protein [Segetibacter sp.]